jgi:hypothetical protein
MVRGDLPPSARVRDGIALDSDQKLRIVLEGVGDASLISGLCATNHISEAQFYDWRDASLAGATSALSANGDPLVSGAGNGHAPALAAD